MWCRSRRRHAGQDPRDLFDPWKPGYPGKADIVLPYQSSLQERVLALAVGALAAATPGPAVPLPRPRPRLPGESPDDYLMPAAEASAARPVEHQWMLEDPRIGQNQIAPNLVGPSESPATFEERWMLDNPVQPQNQTDPNLFGSPVGRKEVPPVSTGTEPSGTPLPKPRPAFLEHPPRIAAALRRLDPMAAQTWSENALALRTQGIEIKISSGFRTPAHNEEVGGAPNSQHLYGTATDIPLAGLSLEQKRAVVSQFLSDPRVKGFGYYPNTDAIHVDIRPGKRSSWGLSRGRGSVGLGWPKWLTDQVREWVEDALPSGPRQ